jgi:hypothetical protein
LRTRSLYAAAALGTVRALGAGALIFHFWVPFSFPLGLHWFTFGLFSIARDRVGRYVRIYSKVFSILEDYQLFCGTSGILLHSHTVVSCHILSLWGSRSLTEFMLRLWIFVPSNTVASIPHCSDSQFPSKYYGICQGFAGPAITLTTDVRFPRATLRSGMIVSWLQRTAIKASGLCLMIFLKTSPIRP